MCPGAPTSFGYEMDLNELSDEEMEEVKKQIVFMKQYRQLLQFGTFYRLQSPFESDFASWMVVSEDRRTAIVGWYKFLNEVNGPFHRVRLEGLDPEMDYRVSEGMEAAVPGALSASAAEPPVPVSDSVKTRECCKAVPSATGEIHGGDELMHIGLITTDSAAGECRPGQKPSCDFDSRLYILQAVSDIE